MRSGSMCELPSCRCHTAVVHGGVMYGGMGGWADGRWAVERLTRRIRGRREHGGRICQEGSSGVSDLDLIEPAKWSELDQARENAGRLTWGLYRSVPICPSLLNRRSHQPRNRPERRLRRIQAEPEVLVAIGGIQVGGLVPVGVPARPDLRAALVFAQADRRHVVLEWRRVGVR